MGNANNLTRIAIKSMPIPDTEATENGENKNPIPQMQIQSYDAVKNCGKLGHYGYYGNAPTGSLVMVIQANGQEECLFGAEDDVNNRPRGLKEGEIMMYNTLTKNYIFFDSGSKKSGQPDNKSTGKMCFTKVFKIQTITSVGMMLRIAAIKIFIDSSVY